ncbi:MAG: DUF3108 domain-containing protein [Gemmatimonadota bacterium]|nr:DUF3108 domain-containing protein [Gemmatimonadota bacterium]
MQRALRRAAGLAAAAAAGVVAVAPATLAQVAAPATTTSTPLPPSSAGTDGAAAPGQAKTTEPFAVGETAAYDVKFGALKVGSASTVVQNVEDIRGIPALHTVFRLQGGTFFFRVNDVFESWIDRSTFSSLRFNQTQQEGSNDRQKRYEIYPDRSMYVELDKTPPREHVGVRDPLDDGSFLFFVRTLPLEVGKTYESDRYFRPERNPIRIRVLRRETIVVPAGKFDCIVLQPSIQSEGIFSQNGNAEVWLSDDSRHILVQLKSKLSFGSINLYLRSYKPRA